jgi:hypothetical protein
MPRKKKPKVKVVFDQLGDNPPNGRNSTNFGEADKPTGEVVIDPRQPESELLDTAVHEALHVACPFMAEEKVAKTATIIAETLWSMGYRRK